ncbi:diacylglycerol/lipid kinase family protein [Chloroflexota bacterium]
MADNNWMKIIVNPAAGAGRTQRVWPEVKTILKGMPLKFEYILTEAPGHAIEIAREAAADGWDMIVSVGGDGTVHEVANGMHRAGTNGQVVLGIIGVGTGADFMRTLGIPHHHEQSARQLLSGTRRKLDIGIAEFTGVSCTPESRVFVNFAGLGFAAEIVRHTTRRNKALGALPSYLSGLVSTLWTHQNREVTLVADGTEVGGRLCTVLVHNGRYSGGGMCPAPNADPADGLFDLLIIDDISRPDLVKSLPRIYRGTHLSHPKVRLIHVKEVEAASVHPLAFQVDGELLGTLPVRIKLIPGALTVAV